MKEIINLNQESFDKAIASGISIVDYWAPWCAPCRMQGPILESLAKNSDGIEFNIYKLNVDDNREIAMRYGINSIPTIMIFKDGEVKNSFIGVQSENSLLKAIQ
jgi:thioredoxin 1